MSSQDLRERLAAVGVTQKDLAERFDVKPSAVSNWFSRDKWPDDVEAFVAALEEGEPTELLNDRHIPAGNLVKAEGGLYRVIRRDRCENFRGKETWIYWLGRATAVPNGYRWQGPVTSWPEKYLEDRGEVNWVEAEKEDRTKQGKGAK